VPRLSFGDVGFQPMLTAHEFKKMMNRKNAVVILERSEGSDSDEPIDYQILSSAPG
jgi:hypothetical protein